MVDDEARHPLRPRRHGRLTESGTQVPDQPEASRDEHEALDVEAGDGLLLDQSLVEGPAQLVLPRTPLRLETVADRVPHVLDVVRRQTEAAQRLRRRDDGVAEHTLGLVDDRVLQGLLAAAVREEPWTSARPRRASTSSCSRGGQRRDLHRAREKSGLRLLSPRLGSREHRSSHESSGVRPFGCTARKFF
ncbi:MAG: hypothetical protein FJ137_06820 [Deltaproteobacteria bacterium]|nr:hypothetical protein [Deltaproteobacteria bacterium]